MSRFLCALTVCALLPLNAFAGEHRDAVMEILNAFESTASKADLDAIGDTVVVELKEIADDESVATSRRGRAISALQFYPSDDVRTFLEAKLQDGDKPLYQRKAIGALGVAYGEAALSVISPYLKADDEQVRMATARALGAIGGEAAKAELEGRRKKEKVDAVVEVIDEALQEVSK